MARKEGIGRRGFETGAETDIATTISVAEEATASSAGNNRACSDGGNRENECSSSKGIRVRDRGSSKTGSLCNGSGPRKELLYLWRFWAYGPPLQESRSERKSSRE